MKTYCICGGGALGHVIAGVLVDQGLKVNILTNRPKQWLNEIEVKDNFNKLYHGSLSKVSSDPKEVISESDIILLALPGFLIQDELILIKDYLKEDAIIGSVVSSTGFFIMAYGVLGNKYNLFGFQRSPYIARINKYGESAFLLGYKPFLKIAFLNNKNAEYYASLLQEHLRTPIIILKNILEVTIVNSNPILHPARLYSLFYKWDPSIVYPKKLLFYEEWDNFTSETLIKCDNELQVIVSKLKINSSEIVPLLRYYESETAEALTNKIKGIKAFEGIKVPMLRVGIGFIPDLEDRYFTEDIPYGLLLLKSIGVLLDVSTPTIDQILEWSQKLMNKEYIVRGELNGKDLSEVACLNKDVLEYFINFRY